MSPVWAGALDEWSRMTGSISTLVCIGTGRLTAWQPAWMTLNSVVWVDSNREIQTGNLDRWGDQTTLTLITTTVSADGLTHPYWRHNFDVLDGLSPVNSAQGLYPNLVLGSNAPVQTTSLNDLMAHHTVAAADESVGLVLDVNAAAGQLLDSLDAALQSRIGWLAVAVPDPQLYANAATLSTLNQWADLNGFSVNRWIGDGRSPVRWWVAAPNQIARRLQLQKVRELESIRCEHENESAQMRRELRVLSRLVRTLSDQAQLAAVFREHNQTVIEELELQLEEAEGWIETLQSRPFSTAAESRTPVSISAAVRVASTLVDAAPQMDEQRHRAVEHELLRAQAQINLLKDVMLGRIP